MKSTFWFGALVALVTVIGGIFVAAGAYNVAADTPHWTLTESLLERVRTRSVARRAMGIDVPALDNPELITSGAGNYDAMCAGCHMKPGVESTEMSRGLYPAPPSLVQRPPGNPAAAFWVIKHGIKMTAMPAWGRSMDDKYVWGLVAFLNELPDMPADRYRALVKASGGHKHGGSESGVVQESPQHEHESAGESHVHDDVKASPLAVIDRFSAALSSGDLEKAGAQLDPDVVILESGGAEHSATEYLSGHAKSDAQFLKGSHQVLRRRTARAAGEFAWVATEGELQVEKDGKQSTLASTETMVLRSGKDGWKIVHIHWSSRVKKPGESH